MDIPSAKRVRVQGPFDGGTNGSNNGESKGALVLHQKSTGAGTLRTSSLSAPTLQLTGHSGSVYAVEYSAGDGEIMCSTSFDCTCLLWNHENYDNFNVLKGHKNAVLDCSWLGEHTVATASADKTVQLWDALTGTRLRKWQDHSSIVNACSSPAAQVGATIKESNIVVSASDDKTVRIWDRRQKSCSSVLEDEYPVTAVAAAGGQDQVYSGGIDNLITCWDLKMMRRQYSCKGHSDTITCLSLNPEGTHILSNSMDHTLKTWDIRPYVEGKNRHCKTFVGHTTVRTKFIALPFLSFFSLFIKPIRSVSFLTQSAFFSFLLNTHINILWATVVLRITEMRLVGFGTNGLSGQCRSQRPHLGRIFDGRIVSFAGAQGVC